jgi:hypothetical protein
MIPVWQVNLYSFLVLISLASSMPAWKSGLRHLLTWAK